MNDNDRGEKLFNKIISLWKVFSREQNLNETQKLAIINEMAENSTPGFEFYLLIIFSCIIATIGLVTNSTPVIIGAMLIAPLMSPILTLSMSSLTGRQVLFRRSLLSIISGSLMAILLSAMIAFLGYRVFYGVPESIPLEILSRTNPSPLDLGIALAGGAAAAYALAHPRLTATLPGVAISTALMPPLCTVGVGIAFGIRSIVLGASLLFLTNLAAISFAGIITFLLLGFLPKREKDKNGFFSQSVFLSAIFVFVITIPLVILSWNTVSSARFERQVKNVLMEEIEYVPNSQLINIEIQEQDSIKKIVATVHSSRELTYKEVSEIQKKIASVTQKPIAFEIIVVPVTNLDTLYPPTPTAFIPTPTITSTPLPTATLFPTSTPVPTQTPVPAFINLSSNQTISLFDEPDGVAAIKLPGKSPVWVLEVLETDEGIEWAKVRDIFNREGWILLEDLIIQ